MDTIAQYELYTSLLKHIINYINYIDMSDLNSEAFRRHMPIVFSIMVLQTNLKSGTLEQSTWQLAQVEPCSPLYQPAILLPMCAKNSAMAFLLIYAYVNLVKAKDRNWPGGQRYCVR